MILRRHSLLVSFLFSSLSSALANDISTFNCNITLSNAEFDFTSLEGEHLVNKTLYMPPSTMIQSLRFNLCGNLAKLEGVPDSDQCDAGTRACFTQVNSKHEEADRVVSVVPLMQTSSLNLSYISNISTSPRFISIISKGPEYPHPIDGKLIPQTFNITLFCVLESVNEPLFKSYDGSQVQVEWETPAGCPIHENDDKHDDHNGDHGKHQTSGSGVGWFFLMLFFTLAAYFGLGAYYNYSIYGGRGFDLIPHRDFWREVPYMLSDVISHLCPSVRPRRASGRGYISV